nr:MAG TPA: hypothetical protein [Caudoviricetes sp.]
MMYQLIKRMPAVWMEIYEDSIFITTTNKKRTYNTHRYSLDGVCLERLQFLYSPYAKIPELHKSLWFVHYAKKSPLAGTMNIFSLDGELKQSINDVATYFDMLPTEDTYWVYLIDRHLIRYNLSTHEYHDLGSLPLEESSFYEGSHRGLHFFICEGKSQLVAMQDKDDQGLEEVYRLDFSESGRGYSPWYNKIVPGEIHFLNFYGSDLWVTTQRHSHRIDATTGKSLEVREEMILPKMSHCGNLGYSIFASFYKIFDFKAGQMLYRGRLGKFAHEGKEYSAEYRGILLHEGIFYVSVRVSGVFSLAAFDVQTEKFVWHDLWGGWDIDSVHIVGDRMIANAYDEVRIYQRVSPSGSNP